MTASLAADFDRATLDRYAARLRAAAPDTVASVARLTLSSAAPPWHDSGIVLTAGQHVSWFSAGETVLTQLPTIRLAARFQLWARVGDAAVFRGTRASHSFAAPAAGALEFGTVFPGEWATPGGALAVDAAAYAAVHGDIEILVVAWAAGIDSATGLARVGDDGDAARLCAIERARPAAVVEPPPSWDYLWFLGPAEVYRAADDAPGIACDCQRDAAILHVDAPLELAPGTRLRWRWRIDELPSRVAEDTLPTHDYLSIAVEFDDGQDLTYLWSAALPVGTVFRCPIPTWSGRETHAVIRSGAAGLGTWVAEERDVHADYAAMIGTPPRRIVRVWLIAVSLFQQGRGRCRYDGIELSGPGGTLRIAC